MSAKKGTIIPNAPRGRKRGVPNRKTAQSREIAALIIEGNIDKVQGWIDRVARKNPAKAADIFLRFFEFVQPRLQRTELNATVTPAITYPAMADMDPIEAARVYQEIMQTNANVTFLPPSGRPKKEIAAAPVAANAALPRAKQELITAPAPVDVRFSIRPCSQEVITDPPEARFSHRKIVPTPAPTPEAYDRAADEAADAILRYQRPPRVST